MNVYPASCREFRHAADFEAVQKNPTWPRQLTYRQFQSRLLRGVFSPSAVQFIFPRHGTIMWALGRNVDDSDSGSDDDAFDPNHAANLNGQRRLLEQQQFLQWATRDIQDETDMFLAPPQRNAVTTEPFATVLDSSDEEDWQALPAKRAKVDLECQYSDLDYDSNSDVEPELPWNFSSAAKKVLQVLNAEIPTMDCDPPKGKIKQRELDIDGLEKWYETYKLSSVQASEQRKTVLKSEAGPLKPVAYPIKELDTAYVGTYRLKGRNSMCIICRTNTLSLCPDCENEYFGLCTATRGKCGHVFHTHCIKQWLGQARTCPADNAAWEVDKVFSSTEPCKATT